MQELDNNEINSWINAELIEKVFEGFKSKKSPGTDNLKPIVYKNLPESYIKILECIYKAMILLNFTPTIWKEADLKFIPKPGKDRYNISKSWRPISLTNYPVKALEKLCVWKVDKYIKTAIFFINITFLRPACVARGTLPCASCLYALGRG